MKRHATIRALKGQHLPAQGKRPQGATPWERRHTTILALKGQKHYTSIFECCDFHIPSRAFALSGRQANADTLYPGCRLTLFALPWAKCFWPFRP